MDLNGHFLFCSQGLVVATAVTNEGYHSFKGVLPPGELPHILLFVNKIRWVTHPHSATDSGFDLVSDTNWRGTTHHQWLM